MALAAGAASYIRNVGRSLMYSTADVLKDNTPFLNSLFKESKETASSLYASIKDFTSGKGTDVKSMGKDVISNAWKNLTDDLKTGNWYNKERDSVMDNEMMKMMGFDMEDMDFSFDDSSFDFGSDTDDISDGEELIVKQNAKNTAATIMAVDKVGAKVASSVNKGTAESANYIVSSSRSMNKAMMQLNSKGFATITEAIATLNKNTVGMNEAIAKPLTTFMQNGTIFFTKTTESLNKMTSLLEEIVKRTPAINTGSRSSSSRRPMTLSDIMGADGFSVSAYKEMVTGNIKDMTGLFTSIFGMMGGGKGGNPANMVKGWSPLRLLTTGLMKAVIPVGLTTALKTFDTALKEFIPSMIAKEMSKSGKGGFLSNILRDIFLPKNELVRRVSAKDYNQGPIPFDGQTKKAITDVIPMYLANILSAISGAPVTKYDYTRGSYIKVSDIEKWTNEREKSYARMGAGKLGEDALAKAKGNKALSSELENFFLQAFLTGENIADINKPGFKNSKLGRTISTDAMKLLRQLVRTGKYNRVPGSIMMSRAEMSKYMRELSASGISVDTALVDNSNLLNGTSKIPGNIDKFGYSSLDYLRGIYYNTMGGGGSSGGSSRGSRTTVNRGRLDLPFSGNSSKSSRSKGGSIGSNNNIKIENSDDIEAENAKIDKEIVPLIIKVANLKAFGKEDSKGDEIARLEQKIDQLDAKYIGTNKDSRLAVIQATTRAGILLGDKLKLDKTGNMIRDKLRKVIPDPVINLLNRPIDEVSKLLHTLTESMTSFLWGDGTKDGIFTQIKKKISSFIDKNETLSKFMDSIFGEKDPKTKKRNGLWNETKSTLKEYWSFVKSGFGGGTPSTAPEVSYFIDKNGRYRDKATGRYIKKPDQAARGRKVTRTGLVAVSEGELIIPSDLNPFYRGGYSRSQQARAERNSIRNFYGSFANGTSSTGTGNTTATSDTEEKAGIKAGVKNEIDKILNFFGGGIDPKKKEQFKSFMKDTGFDEIKKARGGIGAGALVGTGVLGVLGSPILGLILGSTVGFVAKSEKAQKFLFGDFDEEGNRKGGFFGKKTSNFLEKVAPDMMRGGTIGLLGGSILIGGPLGMIGGLVAGTAVGFAKKSESAQKFLFGEIGADGKRKGGLFDKDKFNKTLPKVLVGAGLGAFIGPAGGLFTNMVLGAGAGLIASTGKVHDFLFGKKGENGRKKDGLMFRLRDRLFGGVEDLFMNTKNWLKVAIENLGKKIVTKASNIKSWVSKRIARSQALNRVQQTLLRRFGNGGLKALKGLGIGLGAGIFALPALAPFLPYALKGGAAIALPKMLANRRMRKNARRGYNIYDKKLGRNMTAAERMEYRDKHKVRTHDKFGKWDKFDERLSGLKANELTDLSKQLSLADDNGRGMKRIKNEAVTDFYNIADERLNSNQMNKIAKLIEAGNTEELESYAKSINLDEDYIEAITKSSDKVKTAKMEGEEVKRTLVNQYGFKGGLSDITKAQDLIQNELNAISAEDKTAQNTENSLNEEKEINEKLGTILEKGIKIQKDSEEAVLDHIDNTKEEIQKDSEEEILDDLDNPNFSKDKRGRYHDKKTGRFMSQEQVDIARGYRYKDQNDGSQLKQIWNKSKNKWELDLRDPETKEEHKQGEELEEQQLKTNGILEKMSSGFTNLKDKFFGSSDDDKDKESFFDKLKNGFKTALIAGGTLFGLSIAPGLLPALVDGVKWFVTEGIPWITGTLFPAVGGFIKWLAKEGIGGLFPHQDDDAKKVIEPGTNYNANTKEGKDKMKEASKTYADGTKGMNPLSWAGAAALAVPTLHGKAFASTFLGSLAHQINAKDTVMAGSTGFYNNNDVQAPDSLYELKGLYTPNDDHPLYFKSKEEFNGFLNFAKSKSPDLDVLGWYKANADRVKINDIPLTETGIFSEQDYAEGRELKESESLILGTWHYNRKDYPVFSTNRGPSDKMCIVEDPSDSTNYLVFYLKGRASDIHGYYALGAISYKYHEPFLNLYESNPEFKKEIDRCQSSGPVYDKIFVKYDRVSSTHETTLADGSKRKSSGTAGHFGSGIINRRARSGLGSGFVSQLDSKYANRPYGKFSIGEAGCGPAVASMTASLYGKNLPMEAAISKGYNYLTNDGTSENYFGDVLGKNGISTRFTDAKEMINDLASAKPTILLGSDATNRSKANSPFGPLGHYVLAEGFDKHGNVIIDDPELSGPVAYPASILNSAQLSIGTGIGGGTSGLYTINGKTYLNGKEISGSNQAGIDAINSLKRKNAVNKQSGQYTINGKTYLNGKEVTGRNDIKKREAILRQNGQVKTSDGKVYLNGQEVANINATYSDLGDVDTAGNSNYIREDEQQSQSIFEKIFNIISAGLTSIFTGSDASEAIKQALGGEIGNSRTPIIVPDIVQGTDAKSKITNMLNYGKTIENTETYSQAQRDKEGYSDCSSFARRMYKNYLGVDIGGSTTEQWPKIKDGAIPNVSLIDYNPGDRSSVMNKLQPGDLLYFRSKGWRGGKYDDVSHAEIYYGNGQIIGQNASGPNRTGPTIKAFNQNSGMFSSKYFEIPENSGSKKSTTTYDRYIGAARYSGSGSGLVSNAYNNLISKAKSVGKGFGVSKTNNIILTGRGTSNGMLEQLVAAIVELLTKIVDIDVKDSTALANIKSNTDNLAAITEFLGRYKELKKAEAKVKSEDSRNTVDDRFKSIVEQAAAIAKG